MKQFGGSEHPLTGQRKHDSVDGLGMLGDLYKYLRGKLEK
jgi:hypothetical protein